jgi:murein DD-endopeptidase MepM/ murein hydrolase activator NlpD
VPIVVTSIFDAHRDYDGDGILDDLHEGIDFRAVDSIGHNIYIRSVDEGRVIWASDTVMNGYKKSPYGNHVIIDHGDGLWTTYGHLSEIHVAVGDYIHQGQFIGFSGNTGNSTNTHLHFHAQDFNDGEQGYAVPYITNPTSFFDW